MRTVRKHRHADVILLTSLLVGMATTIADGAGSSPTCQKFPPPATNASSAGSPVVQAIDTWEGIIMIVGFGAFALLMSLLFLLIRRCAYNDSHLLDTFFDAGGNNNFAIVAVAVVSRWLWTSSYTTSSYAVYQYGLVGHYWMPAVTCAHLFLFAIVACEFRIKAPGAKTYLQVIYARFGKFPHLIVMLFAFAVNILVAGMVMMEGTRILTSLTTGVSKEVICIVLTLAAGVYAVFGGVGGTLYMGVFGCAAVVAVMLTYFFDMFYNPLDRPGALFAAPVTESVCAAVDCAVMPASARNEENSFMTFYSGGGLIMAVLTFAAGFGNLFVSQGYWHSAAIGKPGHVVSGFLTGGLVYFSIPFMLSFTFGTSYWALTVQKGGPIVNQTQAVQGYLPAIMSHQLMGRAGDFMMYALTLVVVITSVSSEVLSMSSIFIYDIYQTYINPIDDDSDPDAVRIANLDDHRRYNNRSVVIKHITVAVLALLVFPITLALLAIGIDLPWLFLFVGVICGAPVVPIVVSVTWHRTTGVGIVAGCVAGFAAAVAGWLIYASTFDGGLGAFRVNTGRPEVFGLALGLALGVGGLTCVLMSLACGGCDNYLDEDEVWEKTHSIDNPLTPWTVRYEPHFTSVNRCTGRPHFKEVRRGFKAPEVVGYFVGILLTVIFVMLWPALMLLGGVFSCYGFAAWVLVVIVFGVVAAAYIGIIPIFVEIVQVCRQASYQRETRHERLTVDDDSSSVEYVCHANHAQVVQPTLQTISVPQPLSLQPLPLHPATIVAPPPVLQTEILTNAHAMGHLSHACPNADAVQRNRASAYVRINSSTTTAGNNVIGNGITTGNIIPGNIPTARNDQWKTFIHLD